MLEETGWTDQRIADLKTLWADGLSASQIAGELGGVSRNGVIGKVHRLGLSGRTKGTKGTINPTVPRAPRQKRQRIYSEPSIAGDELPPTPIIDLEIPAGQRRTLLQLTEKTCRWPVGEISTPEFFFCGADADNAVHPYCAFHHRVASNGAPGGMPRANNFRTFR